MDQRAMRALVREGRVGHLATVGADGRPHAVPTCFVLVGEIIYSAVDHKPKRSPRLRLRRFANIEATGQACLLVVRKYQQYARRPPAGPVLALDVHRWSGWAHEKNLGGSV